MRLPDGRNVATRQSRSRERTIDTKLLIYGLFQKGRVLAHDGVKILNAPVPPTFRESVRYAEQNLYTRSKQLVGDRDPRSHEFSLQLRAMDNDRSGTSLGLPTLMALCGGLLEKSTKGGLIVVGALNLGGSVEPLTNAVGIIEVAVEKGADTMLMPVSARKQLFELSDDMATRINIQFYSDTPDALLKALLE